MVEAGGIERPTTAPSSLDFSHPGTEKGTGSPALTPDLAEIVTAWPDLAAPIKAACLALVRSAQGGQP